MENFNSQEKNPHQSQIKLAAMSARSPTGGRGRNERGNYEEAPLVFACVDSSACLRHHGATVTGWPRLVILSPGKMWDLKFSVQEQFPKHTLLLQTLARIGCAYSHKRLFLTGFGSTSNKISSALIVSNAPIIPDFDNTAGFDFLFWYIFMWWFNQFKGFIFSYISEREESKQTLSRIS